MTDFETLGADLYTCSPYKFLGPHCGVAAADPELLGSIHPDKLLPSTDVVPERFEFGTLPYELLAGVTAAVDFLAGLDSAAAGTRRERIVTSLAAVDRHEQDLRDRIESALQQLPGVTVHSRAKRRTPTLLLTFDNHDAADGFAFLADRDINAPAGNFYAVEPSGRLGLGESGGLRVGLAPYNTAAEAARLVAAIEEFLASGVAARKSRLRVGSASVTAVARPRSSSYLAPR